MMKDKFLIRCKGKEILIGSRLNRKLSGLGFTALNLRPHSSYKISLNNDEETACILIRGKVLLATHSNSKKLSRKNQFSDLPVGVFVSGVRILKINNIGEENAIVVISQAKINLDSVGGSRKNKKTIWIDPADTEVINRGRGIYRRTVRVIMGNKFPATNLICGETINPSGHWSSFPPHKHDTLQVGESIHNELYFFTFAPDNGWGYQEIYSPEKRMSKVYRIESGDIMLIPYGYHPVVTAPGYSLCYFWVLTGPKRNLLMKNDPQHSWIIKND